MTVTHTKPNTSEIILQDGTTYLCYYNSVVASIDPDGNKHIGSDWDASRTTMARVCGFFDGQSAKETRELLTSESDLGKYI